MFVTTARVRRATQITFTCVRLARERRVECLRGGPDGVMRMINVRDLGRLLKETVERRSEARRRLNERQNGARDRSG